MSESTHQVIPTILFVEPNGEVWHYYSSPPERARRYGLIKRDHTDRQYLSEEVLPGITLRQALYACMHIQWHEEMGRLDKLVAGEIGRFSRDIAFLAVLYAIRDYGYRLYDFRTKEDTTIEWLQKSLNYSIPWSQREMVIKLLASLVSEELER